MWIRLRGAGQFHIGVAVFICGDAVYRHATAALKWTSAALVAMLGFPAHADVSGPACVMDGDTLVVNGKRRHTRWVGGTRVRLFGIDAPELKQRCKHPSGRDFLCGRAAAAFLLEHVRGGAVECKGDSVDKYGRLIAICFVDGKDLNALMVGEGWALASLSLLPRNGPRNGHGNSGRDGVPRGGMSPPAPTSGQGFLWPSDGLRHR